MGRLRLTGFIAWLIWSVAHIYFLIGFRNRLSVALNWAWNDFTFQRGTRLITGLSGARMEGMAPPAATMSERVDAKDAVRDAVLAAAAAIARLHQDGSEPIFPLKSPLMHGYRVPSEPGPHATSRRSRSWTWQVLEGVARSSPALAGKVALVTGSTSGIGLGVRACAGSRGRGNRPQRLRPARGHQRGEGSDRTGLSGQGNLSRRRHVEAQRNRRPCGENV